VKIFGIDPGSDCTGYGCLETDGSRHRLLTCGALLAPPRATFPEKLLNIHDGLTRVLAAVRPDCVAIENLFHARNVQSALKLGHARGVAVLAAIQAGYSVAEYTPAEIKRAVVGYGRAEKHQVQEMVRLLLGLEAAPRPHDVADALAVAICHTHTMSLRPSATPTISATRRAQRGMRGAERGDGAPASDEPGFGAEPHLKKLTSWRQYRPTLSRDH
jgi:crossover junction endodeoxyribonuclease RuvC